MATTLPAVLRFGDIDAQPHTRTSAPSFFASAIALSLFTGIALFMFFHWLGSSEFISSYGILYLMIYEGILLPAVGSLIFGLAVVSLVVSGQVLPDKPRAPLELALKLFGVSLLLVGAYLYFTFPNTNTFLWDEKSFSRPLEQSEWNRVLYTESVFVLLLLLSVTNILLAIVAHAKRGDLGAANHLRALLINLPVAALSFMTTLPYEALNVQSLHYYVIAAGMLHLSVFMLCLHVEFRHEQASS